MGGDFKKGRWTAAEVGRLSAYYSNTPANEFSLTSIAGELGRKPKQVSEKARNLGLEWGGAWSDSDIAKLIRYYAETPPETFALNAIAATLGRERMSVAMKANRLGLTDKSRGKNAAAVAAGKAQRQGQWTRKPHPRGMAGKKHSEATKAVFSETVRARWERDKQYGVGLMSPESRQKRSDRMVARQAEPDSPLRKGFSRGSDGRRADLGGLYFRSSWEANYARYLTMLMRQGRILRWEFEPETFWFEKILRGVRSYLPDFKVYPINDGEPYYVEVKGWMDRKSATKLKRMKKYHPHIRVDVVGEAAYKLIERRYANEIPHWEKARKSFQRCDKPEGGAKPPEPIDGLAIAPGWLTGSTD